MTETTIVEAVERLSAEAVGVTTLALTRVDPDLELTLRQWRALVVIESTSPGLRIGEIAARLGSSGPSTSRLVRRLEERGLVDSRRDESDRRATLVRLTAAGERLRTALVEQRRDLIHGALSTRQLPSDGSLAESLDHIADCLADLGRGR
jgi:DNA-binding MarR family transcriptional regulator